MRACRLVCSMLLAALCWHVPLAAADPEPMTRQAILDIAANGLGNGYKWGHGFWNEDGTGHVACAQMSCSDCDCIKRDSASNCTNWYPAMGAGADCSGYVAKAWQVPSPSPIGTDNHPYNTKAFRDGLQYWTQIERSELKPGDALVYRNEDDDGGHIVLFESVDTSSAGKNPKYNVYEAAGCLTGIVHRGKVMDPSYVAIRRNLVTDIECKDDTCNHHGECSPESGCACQAGYDGKFCERCELGFVGYPSCTRADSMCKLSGTVSCEMKPVRITPQQGTMAMANYSCGEAGLDGGELAFRFDPTGVGRATVSIESAAASDARILLLRGACAPEGCVAANARSLEFEFGGGEPFFLAVDTKPGTNADVTLKVDCTRTEANWIGDPCNDASDCGFSQKGQNGFCYDTGQGGFCSLPCTKLCPDMPSSKPGTYCIADPANSGSGICVPKAHTQNQRCAALAGTAAKTTQRFNGNTASAEVCLPGATAPSCNGGFMGRVVELATNAAVAHARVSVEGISSMLLETDAQGQYQTKSMPCGSYTLSIDADGFAPAKAAVTVTADTMQQMTALRAVAAAGCTALGSLTGLVFDAISPERSPISGASVSVQAGLGQGIGPILVEAASGEDGRFTATGLPAGTYTVSASAPGYSSADTSLSICGSANAQVQDIGLTSTTKLPFRAVLRWSKPKDLDLHLQTPQGDEVYFYTPCRGQLERSPFAHLDVDRRNADGPEVVSVANFLPGRYTVFVHNYSAQTQGDPTQLPDSGAEIVAYGENNREIGRFAVPASGSGLFWDVFSFDGADPTKLTPIQTLTQRPDPELEYTQECRP